MAFVVCGACAGAAGVLFLARLGGVDANAGTGYELPVDRRCVVGGVNIFGGSGTVFGALLGAMLLAVDRVSLSALSIPEFWQQAVNGALLLRRHQRRPARSRLRRERIRPSGATAMNRATSQLQVGQGSSRVLVVLDADRRQLLERARS